MRKKTTVYIDEALLRRAKMAAAHTGKHEYEIFEEALRKQLGLYDVVERVWNKIGENEPSEAEAEQLIAEELAAVRAERNKLAG